MQYLECGSLLPLFGRAQAISRHEWKMCPRLVHQDVELRSEWNVTSKKT
jgi:hypothetical protein